MKNIIWFTTLVLAACGSGNSGSSGASKAAVQGTDLSGTYRPTQIQCMSSNVSSITSVATTAGVSATVAIQGNSFTASDFAASGCSFGENAQIVFNPSNNQVTISNMKVVVYTQGSCQVNLSLNQVSGSQITPSIIPVTYSNGQTVPDKVASYFVDSLGNIFLFSNYQDANPSDLCFLEYQKI